MSLEFAQKKQYEYKAVSNLVYPPTVFYLVFGRCSTPSSGPFETFAIVMKHVFGVLH